MATDAPVRARHALRGIVFDLDGTLVDSYAAIADALNHARSSHGLQPLDPGVIRTQVGRGLESLIEEHLGADRVGSGVDLFRERYGDVFLEKTFALPGVRTTLAELSRRGFRMCVASNKPARFSRRILDALELSPRFDWVSGPDVVGSTKPDPEMLHSCLARLELERAEAIYVGDMVLDVETGRRAGVDVLLVPGGSSNELELRRTGAPVLAAFGDLLDRLGDPAVDEPRSG